MAMNETNRRERTHMRRHIRFAAVSVVLLVALGYAAIPLVEHAVSSPRAAVQFAPASRTPGTAVAHQALETAAAADASLRSHVLNVGTDRTDHSRECQPDAGITTACIYN